MTPDEIGQRLHDRATRGETLTPEEEERLRRWYADHDQEEMAQLNAAPVPSELTDIQARLQHAAAHVVAQAQRIEAMTAENAQLRQEIASLQSVLSAKLAGQAGKRQ
jgi:capsule polysaccharide export protein KpsE/RkpR